MDFKSVISSFTGSTNIGYYMMHLPRSTERLPLIEQLQYKLNTEIPLFEAADGHELIKAGHPQKCGHRPSSDATRGAGDIGCTVSHVNIARDGLHKGYDFVVIFEDDCEMISSLGRLNDSLVEAKSHNWDLFLLGSSANLERIPIAQNTSKILSFYGTHCLIMNRKYMENLLQVYKEAYTSGMVYSADGMYSIVCKTRDVTCIGFRECNLHFRQKPGVYSYILEGVRR